MRLPPRPPGGVELPRVTGITGTAYTRPSHLIIRSRRCETLNTHVRSCPTRKSKHTAAYDKETVQRGRDEPAQARDPIVHRWGMFLLPPRCMDARTHARQTCVDQGGTELLSACCFRLDGGALNTARRGTCYTSSSKSPLIGHVPPHTLESIVTLSAR